MRAQLRERIEVDLTRRVAAGSPAAEAARQSLEALGDPRRVADEAAGASAAVQIAFWVTIAFVMVDRSGAQPPSMRHVWTIEDLPAPARVTVTRTHAGAVACRVVEPDEWCRSGRCG